MRSSDRREERYAAQEPETAERARNCKKLKKRRKKRCDTELFCLLSRQSRKVGKHCCTTAPSRFGISGAAVRGKPILEKERTFFDGC